MVVEEEEKGGLASLTQHHQGDGPASLLGPVSMSTEQCAVDSLVVEVEGVVEVDSESG